MGRAGASAASVESRRSCAWRSCSELTQSAGDILNSLARRSDELMTQAHLNAHARLRPVIECHGTLQGRR